MQALLLQCCAFALTLAVLYLLSRFDAAVALAGAAVIEGAIAALLTWWRGLAVWWRPIQLLFAPALVGALALDLPPALFLAGFLFLLALYWSTFRTQVPYYPSGPRVWDAVARQLPQGRALRVVDIGSGLGGLVLALARLRPESRFAGIELAPLPWLVSCLRARLSRARVRFARGDYEHIDLGEYDAVFAYLSPAAMSALWRKASLEMRPGAMLLSYEFLIHEKAPDARIAVTAGGPPLYVWHF